MFMKKIVHLYIQTFIYVVNGLKCNTQFDGIKFCALLRIFIFFLQFSILFQWRRVANSHLNSISLEKNSTIHFSVTPTCP